MVLKECTRSPDSMIRWARGSRAPPDTPRRVLNVYAFLENE
jgi:hypothetical protein